MDAASKFGWKVTGAHVPNEKSTRFVPRLLHWILLIPVVIRLFLTNMKEWLAGRRRLGEILPRRMKHDPCTGVPLGGIGSGSIGTDFRGGFKRFCILPGMKEDSLDNVKANNFILTVRRLTTNGPKTVLCGLLSCADFKEPVLGKWKNLFEKEDVEYSGLFPRAWRQFKIDALKLTIVTKQLSPVIPNDYEDSSLPVGTFEFFVINDSTETFDVSITFTFRNGTGNPKWNKEGTCRSTQFERSHIKGCILQHTIAGIPVTFAISAAPQDKNSVTTGCFNPAGDGREVIDVLEAHGSLKSDGEMTAVELGVAVCSQTVVPSKSKRSHCFCLVWDIPSVPIKEKTYNRRYTRFFPGADAAEGITERAFSRMNDWNSAIGEWQDPVLNDASLPEWYKSALFNELYILVDGSSLWIEIEDDMLNENISEEALDLFIKYGRFAYLESWENLLYNSYGSHFHASWALLMNWPVLELLVQFESHHQIDRIDSERKRAAFNGKSFKRKECGKAPYDLGSPNEEVFNKVNAYQLHDTSKLKDLNLMFIAMCFRDWKFGAEKLWNKENSKKVLARFYETSRNLVNQALGEWDANFDFMIEHRGEPDTIYDLWSMEGTSAYCGSLWLCALSCVIEMAAELKDKEEVRRFEDLLEKAAAVFERKLFHDGWYYKFDENPKNEGVVMTDQLSGIWWLSMVKGSQPLYENHVRMSLNAITDYNGYSFEKGKYGPVNGYSQKRELITSSIQAEEIWPGSAYALASFLLTKEKRKEAFDIAAGVYEAVWKKLGLQWQTPGALTVRPGCTEYRALGHMRSMSIWAMQYSLNTFP